MIGIVIFILLLLRIVAVAHDKQQQYDEGYGDSQWDEVPLLVRESVDGPSDPPAVSDFDACMNEYIRTGDLEWRELALSEME